ncbi:hypothetical protein [Luteipulveratus flavus]|uniref:DUF559 domain-containing protein n=1 Tax=Luteipulveratus flavus TaxID=3031728 RepID=A0ABT6C9C7_9MICO|nr:hypothetical protein [Luteipulveratus sp. YIM 133296]MDF8265522.1 hypothetical protein [Luteipulveratus sp. YIM 133296]
MSIAQGSRASGAATHHGPASAATSLPHGLRTLVAAHPGGLFLHRDAMTNGVSSRELAGWVRAGLVRRLSRATYAIGPAPAEPEDAHRELTRAMLLGHPALIASHHSALALLGVDLCDVDLRRAYGIWTNGSASRTLPTVRLIRPTRVPPYGHVGGWSCVRPAWAIAQTTAEHGIVAGVAAADHALHSKIVTMDGLIGAVADHEGMRGAATMRRMLDLCDPRAESVGETRLRLICIDAGIEVEPQFWVLDGHRRVARADFRVKGTRLLLEFDGMLKYRAAEGQQALEKEKRREDECRRLGWDFERFTWPAVDRPAFVRSRIHEGLARAAR